MGSFAKVLGQVARVSLETESANILRTARANKVPGSLSAKLDETLKNGHDMKVFGLGTAASMSTVERYARFTHAMAKVYGAMEEELDRTVDTMGDRASASGYVWKIHGDVLRRAARLEADLADVEVSADADAVVPLVPTLVTSPATAAYVTQIERAGVLDRETGGGRLVGHLYCRYFADLFGGQMLSMPYRVALGLKRDTPRHYSFEFPTSAPNRRDFIEAVYTSINEAAETVPLSAEAKEDVVHETMEAFNANVRVYSEDDGLYSDALRGIGNVATGLPAGAIAELAFRASAALNGRASPTSPPRQ